MHHINQLFIDGLDHNGLMFWYEDAKEINSSLKSNK
jgi:hypothetical protein